MLSKVCQLLFFLLLIGTYSVSVAETDDNTWINKTTLKLGQIESKINNHYPNQGVDDTDVKLLSQIQEWTQKCLNQTKQDLQETEANLKALGEPVAGESNDVARKRQNLKHQVNDLKNKSNSCQLIHIQSNSLTQKIKASINSEISRTLFIQTPSFEAILDQIIHKTKDQNLIYLNKMGNWRGYFNITLLILVGISLLIAIFIRALWLKHIYATQNTTLHSNNLALRVCVIRFLPLLSILLVLLLYSIINVDIPNTSPSLNILSSTIIVLGIYLIIRSTLTPCKPAQQFFFDSSSLAKLLSMHSTLLLFLSWLSYLLLKTPLRDVFDINLLYLMRVFLLGGLIIILSNVLWRVRQYKLWLLSNWLRIGIVFLLLVSLLAEFLGYRNLSIFLIVGMIGTLGGFFIAVIIQKISTDFFDQLDNGKQPWQLKLREALNVKKGDVIPGLMWIRFLITLVTWGGFIFITLRSWRLSQESELLVLEGITQGFNMGSFHVVPSSLFLAILVFSLISTLSRLFKNKIAEPWINRIRLDRGARDAILTIIGYVGFILAILFASSIAGIEFKNLAVIAGALSVGIGFGLKNIVNNFVSGLILLFERPIRSGDWIEVGNTQGFVKSINIRFTEIQTFDRAEVIVPNSELISNQVTNWMLHDKVGRLILKIGVAYGSDVEKVHDILLEIIKNHPDTISNSMSITPPRVLFLEFGDSSLNFELRFFLRDISRRRVVTSEINFSIDKAFREASIEIPFPQQDIHIKRDS